MNDAFPVSIERTPAGTYRLHWRESDLTGPVRIRVHTEPEQAPHTAPAREGAAPGVEIDPASPARHYFHLEPAAGEAITAAQRDVALEGGTNFRDMGGYRAADGRRVRWGKLFRSGHSSRMTDDDRERVAALDIRTCCDFRRHEERLIEPNGLPESVRIVGLQLMPGSAISFYERIAAGDATPEDMAALMQTINRDFVRSNTEPFRRMFALLLAQEEGAFMINCAAGKDRTGFGAAMILMALGVSEQDIVADYMLSLTYFPIHRELDRVRRKYVPPGGYFDKDVMLPMMEARGEYIAAALEEIRALHPSREDFLLRAFGLGEAELRRLRERLTA